MQCTLKSAAWGAELAGQTLSVGSRDYLASLQVSFSPAAVADMSALEEDGCSVVCVALGMFVTFLV